MCENGEIMLENSTLLPNASLLYYFTKTESRDFYLFHYYLNSPSYKNKFQKTKN